MKVRTQVMDRYIPGIGVLRMVAAFLVVGGHFGFVLWRLPDGSSLSGVAVPLFVLTAFWLAHDSLCAGRCQFLRLARWFFVWGVVYIALAPLLGSRIEFVSVVKQLVFGVGYCNPLHYLMNVLVLALGAVLICPRVSARGLTLPAIGVGAVLAQYLGVNLWLTQKVFGGDFFVAHAVGRIVELMPLAVCGMMLREYEAGVSAVWLGFGLGSVASGVLWSLLCPLPVGFGYQGLPVLLISVGVFDLFLHMRMPVSFGLVIRFGASLTPGVYFLHLCVGGLVGCLLSLKGGFALTAFTCLLSFAVACGLSVHRYTRWLVK